MYFGVRKLWLFGFFFLEFISLLFLHKGLSPHKKKKERNGASV